MRDRLKRRVPRNHCVGTISSSCCFSKEQGRNDAEDSGTSKPEEAVPSQKAAYDPYLETLIGSDDEEIPTIKELLRIGAQFIGYRDYASKTEEKLAEVNERADTLAQKLEQSEEARKKAESDAVEARQEDKTSQEFELEDPDNDPLLGRRFVP
ncbi:hypothetical protein QYE76_025356 [Lolium multiflorum]|uniref:Uncharacterized protein n=1 Tax=Lolium multiflorum TaxID=4521 RepID=A0AAD8RGN4_LOLMU|nr:hypothetical protein QYE76_025356 [Lolium multiflorum]